MSVLYKLEEVNTKMARQKGLMPKLYRKKGIKTNTMWAQELKPKHTKKEGLYPKSNRLKGLEAKTY